LLTTKMSQSSHRLSVILGHVTDDPISPINFCPTSNSGNPNLRASPDDIVVVSCVRTPIGKAQRGYFKDTHWTHLLAVVLKEVVKKGGVDAKDIEDIQVGTVRPAGGGAVEARMAMFSAGYPETTCLATTNRQCSSGLQAFVNIAHEIQLGIINIGVAAGVESMSGAPVKDPKKQQNQKFESIPMAMDCLLPMGITSENVIKKYHLTRQEMDLFGYQSQTKAVKAKNDARFNDEIVPVHTTIKEKDEEKEITVKEDEGIRATTLEGLAKLKPAFTKDGGTTAGNASQVSDGAAAVLVMKRSEAQKRCLPILGRFISYAVAGVPPAIMGVGPAYAIPPALEKAGLSIKDIDIFEINEAFASQCKFSIDHLGIPMEKVNPLGGAIALGHPLGMTGARLIGTLLYQLKHNHKRFGVVSMCMGTGMGAAAVFEA